MADAFDARLAALLRTPGVWTTAVVDTSGDTADPRGTATAVTTSIADRAGRAGAPGADVVALREALADPTGLPSPVTRVLLVADGAVALDETIPVATGEASVTVGTLPSVLPLLAVAGDEFAYVTVSVSRDGGDVALLRTDASVPTATVRQQGRTDNLHLASGGGQGAAAYQHRVEQQWKANQQEVAARVDRVVQDAGPRLVVVSGDVSARGLLLDALAERSRELVVIYPKDLRAAGADESGLRAFVADQVTAVQEHDLADALDVLRTRLGEHGAAATGVEAVTEALRESRVQQVLLAPDGFGDAALIALDAEPWVARTPDDAASARVVGESPAAEAIARAALLTGARVRRTTAAALDGESVAALLRWA